MKHEKIVITHYLKLSYKVIITNRIVHYALFLLEVCLILIQILEIYCNNFHFYNTNDIIYFNPLTKLLLNNKLSDSINFIIYVLIILFIIINSYILNISIIKPNKFIGIIINLIELLFYRVLSLFIFNYLFTFRYIYLLINSFLTIIYIFLLIFNFSINHLYTFFPNLIKYPYDEFSMIIDLHFLVIKIFLSMSANISIENISKFFLLLSILFLYILLFYLTYLLVYKSYYLMNNSSLSKIRYSIILSTCIIIIFIQFLGILEIYNFYSIICYFNILILCLFFICYFYDPYKFSKLYQDDNIENVYYYFFILNRDKNKNLLLEEKIYEHLSKCNICNLCKKYKNLKIENNEVDLYKIIYNGRLSFVNNSYYLINIIYIYNINIIQKNYNLMVNTELLYDIINSENTQFLDDYEICLNRIKHTINFIIKAKKIIKYFYEILNEKKIEKRTEKYFIFGEMLNELKYKEIKSNINNNLGNNNGNNLEKLPSCHNLITICSFFYEELYNEFVSNSGNYIRDSPNILEDLINNNYKNSKQITLEINVKYFKVKIIRAGGHLNKYESQNLFDFFPSIFKNRQIMEMKNILLNSNNNLQINKEVKKNSKLKNQNGNIQYINFNFIIEEKEENISFYRILKLRLSLILLYNINITLYLNGVYAVDNGIIVTENKKDKELLLHFGNKEQLDIFNINKNNNNIITKRNKNEKYFCNKKLVKDCNCIEGCSKYNVYHFLSNSKKCLNISRSSKYISKSQINDDEEEKEEEKNSNFDNSNKRLIFNDIASQSSSITSTSSKNNLISYNRGNKRNHSKEKTIKEFKISKYILFISIFVLSFVMFMEYIYMINLQKKLSTKNEFYLLLKDYKTNFNILFYSILSLTCIGYSPLTSSCLHILDIVTKDEMEEFSQGSDVFNYTNETFNINTSIYNEDSSVKQTYYLTNFFLDFTKLLFNQNELLTQTLEERLQNIIKFLSIFTQENFFCKFKENVTYNKIYQNMENDKVILSFKEENITFTDFLLLMTSRCAILTKNFDNLNYPVYIMNKTGEEIFNNIFVEEKLNAYQENIYLLILDNKALVLHLDITINEIGMNTYNIKKKLKTTLLLFISFNVILGIIVFILILAYLFLFFIVIFNILKNINIKLKEKIGDIQINDIIKKKIDNLKLLLSFYEYDINSTVSDLNNIYNNYKENYNLKIKEELKTFKREQETEKYGDKKESYIKILKTIKEKKLFNYSGRKYVYLFFLLIIITIFLFLYIVAIIIWIKYFKKDKIVENWVILCEDLVSITYRLMTSFYMMMFNNQTLDDISHNFKVDNFLSFTYSKLLNIYEARKYFKSMNDVIKYNEENIIYDCYNFYENINNDFFLLLKSKFQDEEFQFFFTINYFCEWSNVMKFNNYRTIYLQLFSQIRVVMENFYNINYSDIINFINDINIVKIEIIFQITYVYLFDFMYTNIQTSIREMMNKLYFSIIASGIAFLLMILFLIFIVCFIYVRNIEHDCKKFIRIKKVFKVCNINE